MSDTASITLLPKKRRRPALSCAQCRHRKIKCDRKYPCTQCVQSKHAECSYSPDTRTAPGFVNVRASAPLHSVQRDIPITKPSRNTPGTNTTTSSAYPSSAGVSPPSRSQSDGTYASSWHSPIADVRHEDVPNKKLLSDRLERLESAVLDTDRNPDNNIANLISLEASKELRGTISKTRFFGQSHWMYSHGAFDKIACLTINGSDDTPHMHNDLEASEIGRHVNELVEKCKAMARRVKSTRYSNLAINQNQNFRDLVPPREICDRFVENYLRTSESTYRVLHIPSFKKEYTQFWEQPGAGGIVFTLKLLLVMAIGVCYNQGPDFHYYRQEALKWIFAAQSWLSSPFEKARLHMSGLQIHCLLLFARQENSVAGDLVWISGGSLLRMAFQMGFHRDPKFLPKMPVLQAEMRRRLWATIIELNIQSSLESGMPSLLSAQDFDTEPPANIDDDEISESMVTPPASKPHGTFTQTYLQRALLKSIPLRLEIVQLSNNFHTEPSYDRILYIGSELTKILKEINAMIAKINRSQDQGSHITKLRQNMIDLHIRRFILVLHRSFAAKCQTDPRYYFSRKICLDSAMTMLTYPSSDSRSSTPESGHVDDFTILKTVGGGFFKGITVNSAMVIFSELAMQLEEDSSLTEQSKLAREPMKQALRDIIELAVKRISFVDNNIKGHLFISVVLAQIEATENGTNPEQAVLEAAKSSTTLCYELLKARMSDVTVQERVDETPNMMEGVGGMPEFDLGFTEPIPDWSMDDDIPDMRVLSGFEDGTWWHL